MSRYINKTTTVIVDCINNLEKVQLPTCISIAFLALLNNTDSYNVSLLYITQHHSLNFNLNAQKVFNLIDYCVLLSKLNQYNLNNPILVLLEPYISKKTLFVQYSESLTSWYYMFFEAHTLVLSYSQFLLTTSWSLTV